MPVDRFDHAGIAYDDLRDGPIQNIAAYLGSAGGSASLAAGVRSVSRVAASAAINTTETLVGNVALALPTTVNGVAVLGTLNVGSIIRVTITGTCTSTNADLSTFKLYMGTVGTVAGDTALTAATALTCTSSGTGTNVGFKAVIDMTIRTLGAAGTADATLSVIGGATGVVVNSQAVNSLLTAVPTTTATFLDVSYTSAAVTTTCTFQQTFIEVIP
jgi:hypothetical protein